MSGTKRPDCIQPEVTCCIQTDSVKMRVRPPHTAPSYFTAVWDLINTAHFSTICLIFLARLMLASVATVYTIIIVTAILDCATTPYKLVTVYIWQFNETCQDCSCKLPSNSPSFDHFELDTALYKGHKSQVLVLHLQCKVQAHISICYFTDKGEMKAFPADPEIFPSASQADGLHVPSLSDQNNKDRVVHSERAGPFHSHSISHNSFMCKKLWEVVPFFQRSCHKGKTHLQSSKV